MSRKKKVLMWLIIGFFVCIVLALGLAIGYQALFKRPLLSLEMLKTAGIIFAVEAFGIGAYIGYEFVKKLGRRQVGKSMKADSDIMGDSDWQSEEELERLHPSQDMHEIDSVGVLINSKLVKGKLRGNFIYNRHAFCCGTSRSGKSTYFIMPMLHSFAKATCQKPCVVITDPKGEMYDNTSKVFRDNGYKVVYFNIREPRGDELKGIAVSDCFNPLEIIYELYHKALAMAEEGAKQNLMDRVNVYIREITASVCPVENQSDPTWDIGSQNLINGIIWGMLEDSAKVKYGMTCEKFTLWQLQNILSQPYEQLQAFCNNRPKTSVVKQLTNHVANNQSEKTRDSYLSNTNTKLSVFIDSGITYLTHKSDISLRDFVNEDYPTIVYLIVADEVKSRHPFVSLFITQLYKELIAVASETKGGKLYRDVYMIIDEAGVFKIPNLDEHLAISASRKIWWVIAVQELDQFKKIYGNEQANIIMANCQLQIYIGALSPTTTEYFSKLFGQQTIYSLSTSANVGKVDGSMSTGITKRQLVEAETLTRISPGEIYYKIFQEHPAKRNLVPIFNSYGGFAVGKENRCARRVDVLNSDELFYDLEDRFVVSNQSMGGGTARDIRVNESHGQKMDSSKNTISTDIELALDELKRYLIEDIKENAFIVDYYVDLVKKREITAVQELSLLVRKLQKDGSDTDIIENIICMLGENDETNEN